MSFEVTMSNSYKQCYRKNAVLKHAHARQSSSLDSRRSSVSRSIDCDLNKLQSKLNDYKKRQTSNSTLSVYSSNGSLATSAQSSEEGDMVHSAPDIRLLFSPHPDSSPKASYPNSPEHSPRLRTFSASGDDKVFKDLRLRQLAGARDLCRYSPVPPLDRRRNSASPTEDRRRAMITSVEDRRHSVTPDYRKLIQTSKLLRRRSASPERLDNWYPENVINSRLSNSSISLQSNPPPIPDVGKISRQSSTDEEGRSPKQRSPVRAATPVHRHEMQTAQRARRKVKSATRQRSKSLELGIKTIDDITNFFENLKVDRRGSRVAKLEGERSEVKRQTLPDIEKKTERKNQNLLPELVVTCPEE
ncbi:hypothetical protein ACHWQZ_G012917 [Mnemiopsis leidyi]